MKNIKVDEIKILRKVGTSGDIHFLINEEINLYVDEDKIASLVLLDKIKPPFDLVFNDEIIFKRPNEISSRFDFEIVVNSENFTYFSLNNIKSNFTLKGKIFGSEEIVKEESYYNLLINQECVCSGKIDECVEFLGIDNNKLGLDDIVNNYCIK